MGKHYRKNPAREPVSQTPPKEETRSGRAILEYVALILGLVYTAMTAWGISVNFGVGCVFMGASVIAAFDLIWRTIRIPRFGCELKVLLSLACIVVSGMILTKGYRTTHRIETPVVLGTPLLRIEPERDILASSNGEFVLRLVNYGVDVDHVLIDQDYFVAQRFGDDIRIKLILNIGGATSPIVLRTN